MTCSAAPLTSILSRSAGASMSDRTRGSVERWMRRRPRPPSPTRHLPSEGLRGPYPARATKSETPVRTAAFGRDPWTVRSERSNTIAFVAPTPALIFSGVPPGTPMPIARWLRCLAPAGASALAYSPNADAPPQSTPFCRAATMLPRLPVIRGSSLGCLSSCPALPAQPWLFVRRARLGGCFISVVRPPLEVRLISRVLYPARTSIRPVSCAGDDFHARCGPEPAHVRYPPSALSEGLGGRLGRACGGCLAKAVSHGSQRDRPA